FYSQTYSFYSTLLFCAASGIVMMIIPITNILYDSAYHESWVYVPFLVIAEVFSSLVTFLGSFYMVSKKNATVPLAIFIGAVVNVVLNFILIPEYGVMGATFATLISYLMAFLIRAIDIRRFVSINLKPLNISLCFLLLMVQGALLMREMPYYFLIQLGMFFAMVILNLKTVLRLAFAFFDKIFARR
ncbi:MAG: polysaccharide biosynthesis C-terminal domain-containing protein, partial [Oscillospiraceae bacterium]|nr:polysaccharide biosynthesis C-terminal domain-containing protein [Oscillospiraceae bacterium]